MILVLVFWLLTLVRSFDFNHHQGPTPFETFLLPLNYIIRSESSLKHLNCLLHLNKDVFVIKLLLNYLLQYFKYLLWGPCFLVVGMIFPSHYLLILFELFDKLEAIRFILLITNFSYQFIKLCVPLISFRLPIFLKKVLLHSIIFFFFKFFLIIDEQLVLFPKNRVVVRWECFNFVHELCKDHNMIKLTLTSLIDIFYNSWFDLEFDILKFVWFTKSDSDCCLFSFIWIRLGIIPLVPLVVFIVSFHLSLLVVLKRVSVVISVLPNVDFADCILFFIVF